jgi:hypothetical protein
MNNNEAEIGDIVSVSVCAPIVRMYLLSVSYYEDQSHCHELLPVVAIRSEARVTHDGMETYDVLLVWDEEYGLIDAQSDLIDCENSISRVLVCPLPYQEGADDAIARIHVPQMVEAIKRKIARAEKKRADLKSKP